VNTYAQYVQVVLPHVKLIEDPVCVNRNSWLYYTSSLSRYNVLFSSLFQLRRSELRTGRNKAEATSIDVTLAAANRILMRGLVTRLHTCRVLGPRTDTHLKWCQKAWNPRYDHAITWFSLYRQSKASHTRNFWCYIVVFMLDKHRGHN